MDERFRDALRRNALLADALGDGPPLDVAALRAELARVRRRRRLTRAAAVAAAALLALAPLRPDPPLTRAPLRFVPPAAPLLEVVRTEEVAPSLELVRTAGAFEIARTEGIRLELAGDEEVLGTSKAVAIVGHPGGPRRLIVAP